MLTRVCTAAVVLRDLNLEIYNSKIRLCSLWLNFLVSNGTKMKGMGGWEERRKEERARHSPPPLFPRRLEALAGRGF